MAKCSASNIERDIYPEVELLNQACLDLVAQIEELKKENARLKELIVKRNGAEVKSELSNNSR